MFLGMPLAITSPAASVPSMAPIFFFGDCQTFSVIFLSEDLNNRFPLLWTAHFLCNLSFCTKSPARRDSKQASADMGSSAPIIVSEIKREIRTNSQSLYNRKCHALPPCP